MTDAQAGGVPPLTQLQGRRQLPHYMLRWYPVFCRNFLFWRKLAIPSLLGNFGEPVLYLLAMGYGLGAFVGEIEGLPYRVFIASGIIASSTMTTASFEAMYSAYTRMTSQATWDAIITTPLSTADVVAGEIVWAAAKGLINASAIALVAMMLGGISLPTMVLALPVVVLTGLCFASMAMVVTAAARGYEFFLYYTTLVLTPMLLLGGVFFPLQRMPDGIQWLSQILPLTHAVAVIRPLAIGAPLEGIFWHLGYIAAVGALSFYVAVRLATRRQLQ